MDRVRELGIGMLTWSAAARALQERVSFARQVMGDSWPDLSDVALLATGDDWLAPLLSEATSRP